MEKFIEYDNLASQAANWHSRNLKIVLTNGCFDLFHTGHLHTFRQAKRLGDLLIVGINSDRSVSSLKGPTRPVISENARAELVAALEPVDYVTIFDDYTAANLLEVIKPHIYVKGGDYQLHTLPECDSIIRLNIELVLVPLVPEVSTTELIRRIRSANF